MRIDRLTKVQTVAWWKLAARSIAAVSCLVGVATTAQAQTLVGRAVLPADTFAPGPTSGQFIAPANGRVPPFVGQQQEK